MKNNKNKKLKIKGSPLWWLVARGWGTHKRAHKRPKLRTPTPYVARYYA